MKINNKGFVATSILYGVVALLLITFLLLLSYYLTENKGNRVIVSNIKEELGDYKYETIKTVELDANGGTVTPKKLSVKYDGVYGALPVASREGYNFLGWYTAKDGGTVVTSSTAYNDIKAKKLYAHWEKGLYNLILNPDGGTIDNSTSAQTLILEYEETYKLPIPTKKGHTFIKWELTGAGSTINGDTFQMGYENTTLTAIWKINTYTLTINPLGGEWSDGTDDQVFELKYNEVKEIPDPVRIGHTFIGWTLTGEDSSLNTNTFTMGTQNAILTASWQVNSYPYFVYHYQQNITADGFTLIEADTDKGEGLFGTAIKPPTKTYKGFTSPEIVELIILDDVEKNKLKYEYLRNKYTLTIKPNGGLWNSNTKDSTLSLYYDAPEQITNPTRDGYTFAGWTVSSGSINNNTYKISDSNATLTANWNVNNYIVTFNANGGNVDVIDKEYTYDGTYNNLPTPTRNGYTFAGWYTEKTGGVLVKEGSSMLTPENHTLYARWNINTYKLTIDPNGGTYNSSTNTQTFDLVYNSTKTIPIPTKKRYTFTGWTLTGAGSLMTSLTESSTFTMGYQNATLVANWEPNLAEYVQYSNPEYTSCTNMKCAFDELFEKVTGTPKYTVTFNANGGSVSPSTITVTYESEYGELPRPTRANYKFLGWYTDTNYTTKITSDSIYKQEKDQTLYAKWEQITLAEYITNLSKTNTSELRVDTHAATGQQNFATTEYRYFGASPNNYISFNGEMWRIIGVFDVDDGTGKIEKRVKIIRDSSIGAYSWYTSSSSINIGWGINEWIGSHAQTLLNSGAYYNRTTGTCYNGKNNASTSCNFSATGLTSDAKALISNAKWYLGNNNYGTVTSENMYIAERTGYGKSCSGDFCNDGKTRNKTWVGQVGLLYPSDYGYSSNMASCSGTKLYDYNDSCYASSWIFNGSSTWTISGNTANSYAYKVLAITSDGNMYDFGAYTPRDIRPVVYLSADVKYNGGTGTSGTNAFQISK